MTGNGNGLRRLRVPATILVGCVWAAAFTVGVATKSYTALGITTPVVLLAAGAVFTIRNGK